IILYELFTGQPLFEGSDPEVLEHHRNSRPKPPRALNPSLSRSLEHLILKLLDKDPNRRYATARQVRRILTNMLQTAQRSSSSQRFTRQRWPALVGRKEPLKNLLDLWAETQQGHGQLVLISGEAGIGKTRLMQELAGSIGEATLIIGRCGQPEINRIYQPFIDAITTYLATTPAELAAQQVGQVLSEAAHFIPEIHQILPNLPSQPPTPNPQSFSLAESIARAAARRPWLLILDDFHWADPASVQLLDYLARHCSAMPMMIVVSYSSSDGPDNKLLSETLNRWKSYPAYTAILLAHLAENEVKDLLNHIWLQPAPADLVGAIYRRTQGNPLFIEETAKSLNDEEV
ncbi:MAG TPA: AAA family ATPase, partial [Anaerolineae bacterium]|nr:AAA family ATPase [Anaerolineae bacterium]